MQKYKTSVVNNEYVNADQTHDFWLKNNNGKMDAEYAGW
jgi:hypothetical protein